MLKICFSAFLALALAGCSVAEKRTAEEKQNAYMTGIIVAENMEPLNRVDYWKSYIKQYSDVTGAWLNLSIAQKDAGLYSDAESSLDYVNKISPFNCVQHSIKADLYVAQLDYSRANAAYKSLISCAPNDATSYYDYAVYLDLYRGDVLNALANYKLARDYYDSDNANSSRIDKAKLNMWIKDLTLRAAGRNNVAQD